MSNYKWVVAVTTAPRKNCTLIECCESIEKCGWSPIVFAEPGSTETRYETIQNSQRFGVWHNWLASANWCLNKTDADVIMTVQDDCLFHPDSKRFAEECFWPDFNTGFLSLYTAHDYSFKSQLIHTQETLRAPGVFRVNTKSLWGACALVFPRKVLQDTVNSKIANTWLGARPASNQAEIYAKKKANPHIITNSDTAISIIMNSLNRSMWFIDPSPVSHIAEYSTCGHGHNRGRRNCYRAADHSISLFDQVPLRQTYQLL